MTRGIIIGAEHRGRCPHPDCNARGLAPGIPCVEHCGLPEGLVLVLDDDAATPAHARATIRHLIEVGADLPTLTPEAVRAALALNIMPTRVELHDWIEDNLYDTVQISKGPRLSRRRQLRKKRKKKRRRR